MKCLKSLVFYHPGLLPLTVFSATLPHPLLHNCGPAGLMSGGCLHRETSDLKKQKKQNEKISQINPPHPLPWWVRRGSAIKLGELISEHPPPRPPAPKNINTLLSRLMWRDVIGSEAQGGTEIQACGGRAERAPGSSSLPRAGPQRSPCPVYYGAAREDGARVGHSNWAVTEVWTHSPRHNTTQHTHSRVKITFDTNLVGIDTDVLSIDKTKTWH